MDQPVQGKAVRTGEVHFAEKFTDSPMLQSIRFEWEGDAANAFEVYEKTPARDGCFCWNLARELVLVGGWRVVNLLQTTFKLLT